ncbi:MAG: leucine-rich repeat protein, partial [Porcipelethomonas sp.]
SRCTSLESITIGSGVTSIGSYAFSRCTSLESITIGSGVTSIGNYAFSRCTSLESISVSENNKYYCSVDGVLFNKNKSELIRYPIGNKKTEYSIPNSVIWIGDWAFSDCESLESITIGNSVTIIRDATFYGCSGLVSITVPDSVISIGNEAFYGCSNLEGIQIENPECEIYDSEGTICNGYDENYKPYFNGTIYGYENSTAQAYANKYERDFLLFGELRYGDYLTIQKVDEDQDGNYDYIKINNCDTYAVSVNIPAEIDGLPVTSIEDSAFYNCLSIESIAIPDSITSIGENAFCGCTSLESITIPETVETIGTNAIGYTSEGNIITDFKIYGVSGSAAETYALGNGITFIDINSIPKLNRSSLYLYQGESFALEVENYSGEVIWGSNDTYVATVKDGYVSAIDDGETTVYAIIGDSVLECIVFVYMPEVTETAPATTAVTTKTTVATSATASTSAVTTSVTTAVTYGDETEYGDHLYYRTVDEDDDGTYDYIIISDCDTSAVSVEIPGEIDGLPVTSIGNGAFWGCTILENIIIPDDVTSIGNESFYLCTSLASITLPDSVTSIGYHAFDDCTSLENINVSENNLNYSSIGGVLFNKDATELIKYPAGKSGAEYVIPDSITSIGYMAFEKCTSLESINIPDGVTSIGSYAFYYCTNLANVTIGNGVTNIGDDAFKYCTSLVSITIPDSVTSIGYEAFYGCSSLESVIIGNGLTSIDEMAFIFCESLASIMIPDSVTNIGDDAFYRCTSLESINVSEENLNYSSMDGVLFNKEATELIRYPEGKSGTEYAIPDSVTSVGNDAFYCCTNLESVTIPDSVASIGAGGFSRCTSLESINIPNSVTSIVDYAFCECTSLASITILNPLCEIHDGSYTISNGYENYNYYFNGTIYGYENSTAQVYAEKYDMTFVALTENPVTTTPAVTTAVTSTKTTVNTTVTASVTTAAPVETTANTDIFDIEENNGTIIIVNCDELVVNIVVPETIGGKEVSKVSEYAFSSENIESVQFDSPDIVITDSETTINEDAVIYGYWDSTAHEYAIKYNREFVSLDGEPETKQGDVSGDGEIDVFDAIQVAQYTVGKKSLTAQQLLAADMNGDSAIDVFDAIIIAKMTVM